MLHKIKTGTKFIIQFHVKQSLEIVSEFKHLHKSIGEKSDNIRGRLNSEYITIPNDDKITGVIIFA
jgi:hypothetical protein